MTTESTSQTLRPARRKFLGEMLMENGVITREQLDRVLARQKVEKGSRVGKILVDLGYVTEAGICEVVAEQLHIPAADLAACHIPNEVLNLVSRDLALKHVCLPWFIEGRDLFLIMADPTNIDAADALSFHTGWRIKPVVAPESEILAAIERYYASVEASLAQFDNIDLAAQLSVVNEAEPDSGTEDEALAAQSAPVVKLVNAMLADGIRAGASDIHIEPHERGVDLRYRVDGLLRKIMTVPKRVQAKIVSRVKIMSHMDISERRKPQDGRTFIRVSGGSYDMRVSSLPTSDGEKVVIRILAQARAKVGLEELGFEPNVLATLRELLRRPQGMILVTGPTGSGKTSTLYAGLNFLTDEETNIVTIEDPVEYRLPGINQVAVSEKAGLTFSAGLRSVLRQDPDIVMLGEIRDTETAQVAFQAAQTGHMVLSTLHTNDAPSTVTRLVEMGVPAYAVASSLIAVLAQRLGRRLCDCKVVQPDGTALAKGCDACRFSGFRGRMGFYELMRLTPRVRSVVVGHGDDDAIRRAARATGMKTLFEDGLEKVARGLTTMEEVRSVLPPDDVEDGEPAGETGSGVPLPEPAHANAGGPRPTRILVVDDNPMLLKMIQETLLTDHYDVITAGDGREALAKVYRERPDLVLTDLRMPEMDGLELVKRLRQDLSTCQIPVLFLTVEESLDSELKAMDLGADDYLCKPVEPTRLLGRVRRALFRAHLLRGNQ